MAIKNETQLDDLKINYLSESLYQEAVKNNQINENEIYMTPYESGSISVDWNDITGKPSTFQPSSHYHYKSQISDFPTSMPASDVYSWAKASSKPTYTKSEVGLGNVDNTPDSSKSVSYATNAGSASSATTASKLGTTTKGSSIQPIYLDKGTPTTCSYTIEKSVPWNAQFTDTKYTHPSYTSKSNGLYKITVDSNGHISGTAPVTKSDITSLGIPGQDTNTTYTLGSFGISATASELNYCDGVTSNIQTQLNNKASSSHSHSQYASTSHSHSQYASSSHSHTASQITCSNSVASNVQSFIDNHTSYRILWSGACYMTTETITLSDYITNQHHGAVFIFCEFNRDYETPNDACFSSHFVSKHQISNHGSAGTSFMLGGPWNMAYRYLYISDKTIRGASGNIFEGNRDGITWNNKSYVLRYVIGI